MRASLTSILTLFFVACGRSKSGPAASSETVPAKKAGLAKDPFTSLTPAAAEALRARMDRLVPAWIEPADLTAVNG